MRWTLRMFAGTALILAAGIALAQPPAPGTPDYFPVKPKAKWVYKVGDQTMEVELTGTEKVGNDEFVKFETKLMGKVVATESFHIKADGVYRVKVKEDKIEPPLRILKLPIKKSRVVEIRFEDHRADGQGRVQDQRRQREAHGTRRHLRYRRRGWGGHRHQRQQVRSADVVRPR